MGFIAFLYYIIAIFEKWLSRRTPSSAPSSKKNDEWDAYDGSYPVVYVPLPSKSAMINMDTIVQTFTTSNFKDEAKLFILQITSRGIKKCTLLSLYCTNCNVAQDYCKDAKEKIDRLKLRRLHWLRKHRNDDDNKIPIAKVAETEYYPFGEETDGCPCIII